MRLRVPVIALAAMLMMALVPALHGAGLRITTPAEAMAAVSGELQGVARGAADLQAQASAAVAGRTETYVASLTADEATTIAKGDSRVKDWLAGHTTRRTAAELQGKEHRWKVSFVGGTKANEVVEAEVYVHDATGAIHEVRVGPQVAWMMARGYDGAFGRGVNNLRVWVPFSLVFLLVLLPITRPRRIVSWRTLDLLVLVSFSISWWYFNQGEIFISVPWQYPPLLYLLARMLWITGSGPARRGAEDRHPTRWHARHARRACRAGCQPGRSSRCWWCSWHFAGASTPLTATSLTWATPGSSAPT